MRLIVIASTLLLAILIALAITQSLHADGQTGFSESGKAPGFPPGVFTDGNRYSLSDFPGKVVVLYCFESTCPTNRGMVPQFNKWVEKYRGKPVVFIGVEPHDSLADCRSFLSDTHLEMPIFVDTFGVMEHRYNDHMSLNNILQFKIIGPQGDLRSMMPKTEDIDQALADAKWKYRDQGYNARLNPAINLFEANQYAQGMALLKPQLKNSNKDVAESAQKLFDAVKAEGAQWKTDADALTATDPAAALDKYNLIATVFAGDDLAKSVADTIKTLQADKRVAQEQEARRAFDQIYSGLSRATPAQKNDILKFYDHIVTKYPDTQTGKNAAALRDELNATPTPVN